MEENITTNSEEMPIKDYKEKDIREKIISKVNPQIRKGRSKHSKGYVKVEGRVVTKVKIPNAHEKIMKESKSQYIATALRLSEDEFNSLIDCPLTGPKYYALLRKRT
jgi:hypothetical protein